MCFAKPAQYEQSYRKLLIRCILIKIDLEDIGTNEYHVIIKLAFAQYFIPLVTYHLTHTNYMMLYDML